MKGRKRYLAGQRFGRLLAQGQAENHGRKTAWHCVCDCGAECVVGTDNLMRGRATSCGCAQRDVVRAQGKANRKHGRYVGDDDSSTYHSWSAMTQRCLDPNHVGYKYYGGRGITIYPAWVGDGGFQAFREYMGERPEGRTLDRYPDNDGNYEPGNVRWATLQEQAANRRYTRRSEA